MKKEHNKLHSFVNFLLIIIFIVGIVLFVYSSINIYKWYVDSNNTSKIIDKINHISSNNNENNNNDNSNNNGMDLSEYKNINPDTVGWIKVNGTNVDYPFTQTTDNDFYLTHSFDKSYNAAGWVFLDYRNDINNLDKNTLLYAHGRLDKTMFGSLQNVLEPSWYNDENNHIIKLYTDTQTTSWQIFSAYHLPETSDYTQIQFNSDSEFMDFVNKLKNRSSHNFETTIAPSDKILTLSTCYNNNGKERLVIHAKQI